MLSPANVKEGRAAFLSTKRGLRSNLPFAMAWSVVWALQLYPAVLFFECVRHYMHYGVALSSWPCWFPWSFGLGYGPGLGILTPPWCWEISRSVSWSFAVLEVLFFGWFLGFVWKHSAPSPRAQLSDEGRDILFERVLAHTRDPRGMVEGWFRDAPLEEVWSDNLAEWVAWALYDCEPLQLAPEEADRVHSYVTRASQLWGLALRPGYNTALHQRPMRISLDPLGARPRPLVFYLGAALLRFHGEVSLRAQGFQKRRAGSMHFWLRPAHGQACHRPLVFLHGVGLGQGLSSALTPIMIELFGEQAPLVLPEYDAISMKPGHIPPSSADVVAAIADMVDQAWGSQQPSVRDATFVSHSWGSIQLSWLIKSAPNRVGAALMLDPVVFLLHLPGVCRDFAYMDRLSQPVDILKKYCAAQEIGLALSIHRHFVWHENELFIEDIPPRLLERRLVRTVLASNDSFVPANSVHSYLTAHMSDPLRSVDSWLIEGYDHVEWTMAPGALDRVLKMLTEMHHGVPNTDLEHAAAS